MLTTREVKSVLVCRKPKKGKEYTADGLPRRGHKIGKVYKTVFDPSGMRVVGFIVRRPDLLWMFKRPEKFLSLDAMDASEGVIRATKGMDSWDDRAVKRCGLDWDKCLIWEGMTVRVSGTDDILGHVDDVSFDEETGAADAFFLDDGGTARALIGSVEIPADLVIGYKDDYLVVKPEAAQCKLSGGLAAKAGTATAKATIAAREGTKKAGQAASKAVDAGAVGLGKGIGRLKRSFTGAVDGFKKEAPASAKKKPASGTRPAGAKSATAKASGSATKAANGAAKKTASAAAKAGAAKATGTAAAKRPAATKAATSSTAKKPAGTAAKTSAATAKKASTSATKKASTSAKTTSTAKKASATAKDAGKAVTDHLKGAGSMFSDFKKEFDKATKE